MKKLLLMLATCFSMAVSASEAELTLPNDNMPEMDGNAYVISAQRGMQIYLNNCMGCHELSFQRYNRTAKDLQIPEEIMLENLVFGDAKIGDLMANNMPPRKSASWFGATPPDLSVVSRARGTKWLYNYLRGFYLDPTRPYGVNNAVFKDVGMPHVLEQMQGLQDKSDAVKQLEANIIKAQSEIASTTMAIETSGSSVELREKIITAKELIHSSESELVKLSQVGEYFTLVKKGTLNPEQFDIAAADLVNFLDYVGEPIKQERKRLGFWVLLFIVVFGVFAYLLKKEYWKDIH